MSTFLPSQLGYLPTGSAGVQSTSTLYIGRNVSLSWESPGFGSDARPDYLETLYINLSDASNQKNPTKVSTFKFEVADIQSIITANSHAGSAALTFQIREVDVCQSGVAMKMMILASTPYATGSS